MTSACIFLSLAVFALWSAVCWLLRKNGDIHADWCRVSQERDNLAMALRDKKNFSFAELDAISFSTAKQRREIVDATFP